MAIYYTFRSWGSSAYVDPSTAAISPEMLAQQVVKRKR